MQPISCAADVDAVRLSDALPVHRVVERINYALLGRQRNAFWNEMTDTFRHGMFDKDKQLLLNAIVHNADIANPALATPLHARWSTSLMQEFNAQYEEEMNQARMNIGFIDLFCFPLWRLMDGFCFPLWRLMDGFLRGLDGCVDNLQANRAYWVRNAEVGSIVT
ncbi:hypothetical protein H257_06023 [Aphanomyces astaci]|uniref:PDEase domain-containing protein n=1 Tax=Aphanomyces astaci TaxID=112090 RepID=W4GQC4_APHAT|nr:hypothetical protein H257_06023 [Aphanomyces astaci]ETV81531.1 hypothetical protein H257_06023 [Aphanomyces astaci]|eukprot:XP_009829389.1 hypothetical protein H257_06023 [Aphanomyces astaci]